MVFKKGEKIYHHCILLTSSDNSVKTCKTDYSLSSPMTMMRSMQSLGGQLLIEHCKALQVLPSLMVCLGAGGRLSRCPVLHQPQACSIGGPVQPRNLSGKKNNFL
jgi:hypothetical protein